MIKSLDKISVKNTTFQSCIKSTVDGYEKQRSHAFSLMAVSAEGTSRG